MFEITWSLMIYHINYMKITKAYGVHRPPHNVLPFHQWPPSLEISPVYLELLVLAILALDSPANREYNVNQLSAYWSTCECTRRRRIHINKSPVAAASPSSLIFEWTLYFLSKSCPTPALQRKWTKKILVNWYKEINERGQYNAIMIEITYGALLLCRSTSLGPNLMSCELQLGTCQLECLARSSGACGQLHKHTCIGHQFHLTSSKQKKCVQDRNTHLKL